MFKYSTAVVTVWALADQLTELEKKETEIVHILPFSYVQCVQNTSNMLQSVMIIYREKV